MTSDSHCAVFKSINVIVDYIKKTCRGDWMCGVSKTRGLYEINQSFRRILEFHIVKGFYIDNNSALSQFCSKCFDTDYEIPKDIIISCLVIREMVDQYLRAVILTSPSYV